MNQLFLTKVQTYKRLEGYIEGPVYDYQTEITTWLNAMYTLVCSLREDKGNEHHTVLLQKYVEISYQKFAKDPEYAFWMGILSQKLGKPLLGQAADALFSEALRRAPQNLVCLSFYYFNLDASWSEYRKQIQAYMTIFTHPESRFRRYIRSKGLIGEYFLSLHDRYAYERLAECAELDAPQEELVEEDASKYIAHEALRPSVNWWQDRYVHLGEELRSHELFEFMQSVLVKESDNVDAWNDMNYFLINLVADCEFGELPDDEHCYPHARTRMFSKIFSYVCT